MGLCVTDGLSIITPETGPRIKSQAVKESEDIASVREIFAVDEGLVILLTYANYMHIMIILTYANKGEGECQEQGKKSES